MSGTPTLCSHVFKRRNAGLSKGADTYDNGVPIVVSGRESLPQGEGEQVRHDNDNREVLVMRNAETVLSIIRDNHDLESHHWRAECGESRTLRSEEGRGKR